jgi:hypothetical protein
VSFWFQDFSTNQAGVAKRSFDSARAILEREQVVEAQFGLRALSVAVLFADCR